jgi:uncharacterized protein YqjF (DUF2071 family)
MAFLTARWSNLVLVNYAVDPVKLRPPPGCTLDERDGVAFISLVAFDFLDTRVLGVPWPGFRDFPEINLRFYVRHEGQRGVAFIREFVPSRLVAGIARALYNEPYRAARMTSRSSNTEIVHTVNDSQLRVETSAETHLPDESSEAHFFKEHSWGFGTSRSGTLVRYRVEHPQLRTREVRKLSLDWNWRGLYGEEWAFLEKQQPRSVFLAVGSEISVSPKQ